MKSKVWSFKEAITNSYGSEDDYNLQERTIIIFTKTKQKVVTVQNTNADNRAFLVQRQKNAHMLYRKQFGNISLNGVGNTEMSKDACLKFIDTIGLERNDVCWEIGCGKPKLSFLLSASATNIVVATDIRKFNFFIIYPFLV
jgi:hypothetical protein